MSFVVLSLWFNFVMSYIVPLLTKQIGFRYLAGQISQTLRIRQIKMRDTSYYTSEA